MMRTTLAGLGAAVLVLSSMAMSRQDATEDPAAKLAAVTERYEKAQEVFITAYRAAETDDERREAMKLRPAPDDYVLEFFAIAQAVPATPTAGSAWMWVARLAPRSESKELVGVALDALVRDHLDSEDAADLPGMIRSFGRTIGAAESEKLLRQVVERASDGPVLAGALFNLAQMLAEDSEPGSERLVEARAMFDRLVADFAEVQDSRERSYGTLAEAWIFELEHLQIGKVAPDIEGADLSGVSFKLSDYRGKVVLLDFWGNW